MTKEFNVKDCFEDWQIDNALDVTKLCDIYKGLDGFINNHFDDLSAFSSAEKFMALQAEQKKAVLFVTLRAGLIDYAYGYQLDTPEGQASQDKNFKKRISDSSQPEKLAISEAIYKRYNLDNRRDLQRYLVERRAAFGERLRRSR